MKKSSPKNNQAVHYGMSIGLSIFMLFFFITSAWIGYEVQDTCHDAIQSYGGDCIGALTTLVEDETKPYQDRNSAIWALGQFGDNRALNTLQNLYTGEIPEREPLDETLSQYELQKAIKLVEGNPNISAVIWRSFLR